MQKLTTHKNKQNRKEIKGSLKRMFGLFKHDKAPLIFTAIFSIFEAAMICASTFIICLIYNNYIIPATLSQETWMKYLILCLVMAACYVVSQVIFMIHNIWVTKVSEKIMYGLRRTTLNKLHLLPIKFFDVVPSGEIMTRMSSDIDNISQLTSQHLSSIFFYSALIVCNVLMMFLINWFLALVTFVAVPIMIVANILVVKKVQPSFIKQQNSISHLNGYAEEMISGTKIISLFSMQDKCLKDFDVVNKQLTKDSLFAQTASNMMMPMNHFLTRIAIFIICALGVGLLMFGLSKSTASWLMDQSAFPKSWTLGKAFSPSALLIVFTMFARNFTEAINNLVSSFSFIFFALAGAQRVFQILDAEEEKDKETAKPLPENFRGDVEAKDLSFGYVEGKLILKHLNFIAHAGQTVAIVGPTGAGKTTITNLVTKFYDPNGGDLLMDGISISDITRKSLRQNISIVTQDTFLFAESVKQNIRYGRVDATDEEIIQAAKEAHAHEFIMQLPHGYDTVLHDNGSDLSAGQRQLLTIARAVLAKPKIVILDEATSSIDTKTELLIGEAMDKLMKGKTSFVVAHRLSTIANADNILVLKAGEIIEQGTHKDLIAKNGFYAQLYEAQFKKGQEI